MVKLKPSRLGVFLGALGVVFGDIGTSPLYAIKVIFGQNGLHLAITEPTVLGVLSLIFWTVTIVVSLKYIGTIMQADNRGEGGIMALVARLGSTRMPKRRTAFFIGLGLVGVALFYGDSAITPAISVLSAAEGLNVLPVHVSQYIVPLTLVILGALFWLQHYGTALIGRLFGPVMFLWFVSIGAAGLMQIVRNPHVLDALSPLKAGAFALHSPLLAFTAMGAVVLAVTGAEALYADMGHFGRGAVARAWFWLVFPALMLCYLGQGALVLYDSSTGVNPFFLLFPAVLHIPMIMLAALATLIASQSVISGAFSLSRQAMQLGFLPRMAVRQTSDRELGQIYVPAVNILLFVAVMLCVLLFGSSERLAGAYGVAVSGALIVDTILFTVIMRASWSGLGRLRWLIMALFLSVDGVLVVSTWPKVWHGGWLPLAFALAVLVLIDSWRKGEAVIRAERRAMEGPLQTFIDNLHSRKLKPLTRVAGQAVFIGHHPGFTPMALHDAAENLHELPKKLVIVYVKTADAAHIPEGERAEFDGLTYKDGISQVILTFGFHDLPNIPHELNLLRNRHAELDFDAFGAAYFISLTRAVQTGRHNMPGWQKSLYILLDRLKLSSSDYYRLPIEQTSEVRTLIKL